MTTTTSNGGGVFALLAEFDSPDALVAAAEKTTAAGYTRTDAYSPFPIHDLDDALAIQEKAVPRIIFVGGLFGLIGGFGLQYYCQVIAYPFNIGGRPWYSWVSWIPPTFEMTILVAALSAFIGMLALNGLPRPYHPVFNAPRFERASQDAFFLSIETADPKFDPEHTRAFLEGLGPREVVAVDE